MAYLPHTSLIIHGGYNRCLEGKKRKSREADPAGRGKAYIGQIRSGLVALRIRSKTTCPHKSSGEHDPSDAQLLPDRVCGIRNGRNDLPIVPALRRRCGQKVWRMHLGIKTGPKSSRKPAPSDQKALTLSSDDVEHLPFSGFDAHSLLVPRFDHLL